MNYGKLDYDRLQKSWVISDLSPHVSIRFKNVFKYIKFGRIPPFVIADRHDLGVDLDWFMSRYPLELSAAADEHLAVQLEEYKKKQQTVKALTGPDYVPQLFAGFRLPESPRKHQIRAAELLQATGRLLLLDDIGLGKTVSALTALSTGWGLPAAVVVQPHLSRQWVKDYINRFTFLRAHEVKDRNVRSLPDADIYMFRYSNIAAWADYAATLGCRTVVFDEIQELRHGKDTAKGCGAEAFVEAAENVIGLTATPIYNYGSEMWNVVNFIAPGALGTWDEFITNWCIPNGTHWIVEDPEALGAYLQEEGITLRRLSDDPEVALSLPGLSKVVLEVDWHDGDVESDRALQRMLALRVIHGNFTEKGRAARELDLLIRQETGIAKARSVAAYVRTLVEAGEPVLLGGWHREVYRIWNECLADLTPVMYTGSESQSAKAKSKEAVLSAESNLIIMSLRSGAGLDGLQQRIAHVVIGELDWSPQVHSQFVGRVHREGQRRPVTAHYLHVNGGSDPVILETLGLKASQSHGILNPYGGGITATPIDELRIRQIARRILGLSESTEMRR